MGIPKTKPADSLAQWLEANDHNQLWLADELGISAAQVNRIVRGLAMPRAALALRIQEMTGVTVEAMARARARITDDNRPARLKHGHALVTRGRAIIQAASK